MHWVINVKYLKDYLLELTFNDNKIKVIDLNKYIGGDGVFKPLKNKEYFKNVKIDSAGNSICWDNGADFCPDVLYEIGE